MTHLCLIAWWRPQMETFPHYLPFVRRIHLSPVNSPHKGQRGGALIFSLICAWNNRWANNGDAGDLTPSHSLWRHCNVFLFNQCLIAAILCWVSASWYRHQMMLIDSYNIFPSYTIDFIGTVWGHYICLINIYSLKCLIRSLNNSECKTSLTKLQMLLFWVLQMNPQENRTKVSAFIIKWSQFHRWRCRMYFLW